MTRIWIVFTLICLNVPGIFCQTEVQICKCDSLDKILFEPLLTGELFESPVHIKGSQYFYDWDDANVTLYSGEVIYNKRIRYNGYINEMIWLMPSKNVLVKLDKSRIKEVYFKNNHTLFRTMHIHGDYNILKYAMDTDIFAEVLLEGSISMYGYRKIKKISSDVLYGSNGAFLSTHVEKEFIYYIKIPDHKSLIEINDLKRKSLFRLFPDRKVEIRKILKDNKLTLDSEANFARVLDLIGKSFYQ